MKTIDKSIKNLSFLYMEQKTNRFNEAFYDLIIRQYFKNSFSIYWFAEIYSTVAVVT